MTRLEVAARHRPLMAWLSRTCWTKMSISLYMILQAFYGSLRTPKVPRLL